MGVFPERNQPFFHLGMAAAPVLPGGKFRALLILGMKFVAIHPAFQKRQIPIWTWLSFAQKA